MRTTQGFFGIPGEDQYNLEVTVEWEGYNNTLAPYTTVSDRPLGGGPSRCMYC